MSRHVVQYSGGIESWAAARRVAAEHGTTDLTLLFADTRAEDEDLHRFLHEGAEAIGVPVTTVADGRTPFGVFTDVRFLGNSRIAPCSVHLKQIPCRRWLTDHTDPADTIVYVGIDAAEERRVPGIRRGWSPWTTRFPLVDQPPRLSKDDMLDQARALGIEPPRMYAEGYAHNNCAGLCVRAGHRQWAHTLALHPDRYRYAELEEQRLRGQLGDVTILTDRRGGRHRPLTLTELRHRQENTTSPSPEPAKGD